MAIYDPKSLHAEEFINDEEIRETLAFAEAHKNDAAMIAEILEKARPVRHSATHRTRKTTKAGPAPLSHPIKPGGPFYHIR